MSTIKAGSETFGLTTMTPGDTPREQLDLEAAAIYRLFAAREREFGFGPNVVVEYPPLGEPPASGFLADPAGHIAARVAEIEKDGPIGRIVVLTTFGRDLMGPLSGAGYTPQRIDMPAGPDHTYAFTLDRDVGTAADGRLLYLEAVDEADEKIRPTFVLKLLDGTGRLCGGACGSIHDRDGKRFAYLATLTLVAGLPPATGTRLAEAMLATLRRLGVDTLHLGTQTAGRFYEKLGFRVTHRLVRGLRTRTTADGKPLGDDLVMMRLDLPDAASERPAPSGGKKQGTEGDAMIDAALADTLIESCRSDGEFRLAARHWTGSLRLESPEGMCAMEVDDGEVGAVQSPLGADGRIVLKASEEVWAKLLSAKPPRLYNDLSTILARKEMTLEADPVCYAQYYPAVMRAIELARRWAGRPTEYLDYPAAVQQFERVLASMPPVTHPLPAKPAGTFDSPVGRYVHLDIEGQSYRIYFEEAGSGIPMLLQHTAGAHGAQWRHLFECREITDHFRLIAYDLPFHGKSLPPVGPKWWAEEYRLTASFARALPVTLARTLRLDRPVFMGCSVGGLLALDLARYHPEVFSAVISLEGALKIDAAISDLGRLWHPQVGNEYKGRLMNGLMSPTSPEAYRKETSQVYASGWPPSFLGDLHYYVEDYDLRQEASKIDTKRTAVHILSGEYDASGTMERGRAAHEAIAGSTWAGMNDVGHFPMSENPEAFFTYLLPILKQVRDRRG